MVMQNMAVVLNSQFASNMRANKQIVQSEYYSQ